MKVSQIPSCTRSFTSSTAFQASTVTQKRRHRDPYAIAQAKARKAANISRQEVLKKERAASLGDPIRGVTTPYVQSFDTALPPEPTAPTTSTKTRIQQSPDKHAPGPVAEKDEHLNFYLNKSELDRGLKHSQWLNSTSVEEDGSMVEDFTTDTTQEEREAEQKELQDTAAEALRRISSLSLGNSKDRLRINKQRCIEDFGRHNTDAIIPPRPTSTQRPISSHEIKTPRAGPDTGSSEVQIAILTAKIRTLADFLQTRGTMDKMNKRNLRLLVHRRQKLLRYLRKKERGGPRWQNVVETLGLTDGTWKGEISL